MTRAAAGRRALLIGAAAGVLGSACGLGGRALAQAIERNLPPPPVATAPQIAGPRTVPPDQDERPIGPALRGIAVLGAQDAPLSSPAAGLDFSRAPRLAGDPAAFAEFLGRPISRRLIAQVKARIARLYRAKGFPFVSVSTPEQELTTGVLQVRLVEFRRGAETVPGVPPREAAYVESRVRLKAGEPIDTRALAEDLDWLNRFPFRRTEAVFTPGPSLGVTDLQLQTVRSKPWSVYGGYANSGSPSTGMGRYFLGAQAGLPFLNDALASYQFTGSTDAGFNDGPFSFAPDPRYLSHAGRLIIPTLPRQDLEASVSYVRSNAPVQDFIVRDTTLEVTLAYRSALSNLRAPLPGEVAIGAEAKRQTSDVLFGGAEVRSAAFDVFQLTLAYALQARDAWGDASGELTLHVSPGGINHDNTDAVFSAFSNGQFDKADYAYVSLDFSRHTRLPPVLGVRGVVLSNTLIGQYAATPLPLTEEIGLGGSGLVRGYTLDDGAFDSGVISRNELRMPAFSAAGGVRNQLSPYVFLDAGYGKGRRSHADAAPVSTGLGADGQFGPLTASLDAAWALRRVGATRSGAARIEGRVTLSF